MNATNKTAEQIHIKAFELRSELFNLVNKIKDLQMEASHLGTDDAGQLDGTACELAAIHGELPWVFTAAAAEQ